MVTQRIDSFIQFANYIEYPMVIFEAESGNVIDINYEAQVLLGGKVKNIQIKPGKAYTKVDFWEALHGKKTLIWNRICMTADGKEHLVSGLINETTDETTRIYAMLFGSIADLNVGVLALERVMEHAGMIAVHIGKDPQANAEFQMEYVSRNINRYGYTRAQLYERTIGFKDIICEQDLSRVLGFAQESMKKHIDENTIECRIITEERDLIPVRIMFRYIYDDYGTATDLELLILDLREEHRRNRENAYLSNAISKMKNVVIVKSYKEGKRNLCYISPNACMVGMNVEALRKGYKLTEDYIHPEDRDDVIDAVYKAIASGVTDYVQVYRLVRDDGKQIWAETQVTVNHISDGEAEISFLITDITQQKQMESELATSQEESPEESANVAKDNGIDLGEDDRISEYQMLQFALNKDAEYYTIVLDGDGSQLTKPVGPLQDIGLVYDLYERPQFKDVFESMSNSIKEQHTVQKTAFDVDQMCVHMLVAPLMVESEVTAYWVVISFSKDYFQHQEEEFQNQWQVANFIEQSFSSKRLLQKETKIRLLSEMYLKKEQEERRVMEEIVTSMSRDGEAALDEMCYKLGMYLGIENLGVYLHKQGDKRPKKYFVWTSGEEAEAFFESMELSSAEYNTLMEQLGQSPVLLANNQSENLFLREMTTRTNRSVLVHKLEIMKGMEGYLVFADRDRNRNYENVNLDFISFIVRIIEIFIRNRQRMLIPDVVKSGLLESYDHFRDAVYVRDNSTGEIIFANKATDKLFGYSIVGMRATDIMTDKMAQYRDIGGVRKRFVDNRKVSKWQTYIKELDRIMNIVEVHMETLYGADWSLIILKKSKKTDSEIQ